MSLALADFLVAVSDPSELKAYRSNPEGYASRFHLTAGDVRALKSGISGWIRLQANSTADAADLSPSHPAVIGASQAGVAQISLIMDVSEIFTCMSEPKGSMAAVTFEDEDRALFKAVATEQ